METSPQQSVKLASSLYDMVSPPNKTVSDTMSPKPVVGPSQQPSGMHQMINEAVVDVVLGAEDVEAVISDTFLINVVDN